MSDCCIKAVEQALGPIVEQQKSLKAEVEGLRQGLRSIAANSCCESCREAGLVAQATLRDSAGGE